MRCTGRGCGCGCLGTLLLIGLVALALYMFGGFTVWSDAGAPLAQAPVETLHALAPWAPELRLPV